MVKWKMRKILVFPTGGSDFDAWMQVCEARFADLNARTQGLEQTQAQIDPTHHILDAVKVQVDAAIEDFVSASMDVVERARTETFSGGEVIRNQLQNDIQGMTQKANAEIQGLVNGFDVQLQNVMSAYSSMGMISRDEIRIHVQSELNVVLPKVEAILVKEIEKVARQNL